jgi:signal transduction histidine kinase
LHNIGNAVNTANCCAELVEDRLNSSRLSGLEMATLMLTEQAPRAAQFFSQDARGPKLIHYLASLNNNLQRERCENLEEVQRLRATINHIRDTIASQQSHARLSDFRQRVNLSELLQETLLVNAPLRQKAGVQVEISSSFPPDADVYVNRSRISQVLVNLQKNALLSMQSVPDREHVLTIAIDVINSDTLEIEIRDTGIGFTSEVRDRLFSQGFTTRKSGSGLGLHYCINVLREMGGDISAYSDGPSLGASFRITVPRAIRVLQGSSTAARPQAASVARERNAESVDESYKEEEQYA